MRSKLLFIAAVCTFLFAGCATKRPVEVSTPPSDPCPLPTGYQLEPAVNTAEQTLTHCPEKLDEVFMALLDIARHSPSVENSLLIQDMLKRLIKQNKISETYTKTLYQKYFSHKFVSIPELKPYNLPGEIDSLKKVLRDELSLKRTGMVACSNDKESYRQAEREYARAVRFMENLVYNEEYLKENR